MDAPTRRDDADAALASLPLLRRALSYEASLRSRTEGLTWAVWGLVFALIFFMYGGMGEADSGSLWITFLWVGWVLAGGALTWALWRTAALTLGGAERAPAGALVTLAWLAAIAGAFGLLTLVPTVPNPENVALVAVGLAWLAMGATNLVRATPTGRASVLLIGATLLVAGLALVFLMPAPDWSRPGSDTARFHQDLLRGALAGAVPLAFGLRQALRG